MSATVESPVTAQRTGSWRDEVFAAYEISQVRLRCVLAADDDQPQEYI